MRQLLCMLSVLLLSSSGLFSQVYNIATENGNTIYTCSGTFYDSGGQGDGYSDNENYQITFCSDSANSQISLDFSELNTENSYDYLTAYEGTGTGGTLLGAWTGDVTISVASISSGCVTFTFTSDGVVSGGSGYTGWTAIIDCEFSCQPFDVNIEYCDHPYTNGDTIDICPGDSISFTCAGFFPNNNINYTQSDSLTEFIWDWGDGNSSTGQTVIHTFPDGGGYYVVLSGWDSNNCNNSNYTINYVRVQTQPIFNTTSSYSGTYCLGDSIVLNGEVASNDWIYYNTDKYSNDTILLPDDANGVYISTVPVNMFHPDHIVSSGNDLASVCINMEHSYLGDLTISLTCPNGQSVNLIAYSNGCGMTYLGDPIDDDSNLGYGAGYEYCWSDSSIFSTIADTCSNFSTMPAGTYLSESPFSDLIGCPLNGNWTLTFFDNLPSDNGWVFGWGLEFSNVFIQDSVWLISNSYPPEFMEWTSNSPGGNIIADSNGTALALPQNPGPYSYTFSTINDFGCYYDTTISIVVTDSPFVSDYTVIKETCYNSGDASIDITVDCGNPPFTYIWSNGYDTEDINNLIAGTYYVTIIDNASYSTIDTFSIPEPDTLQINTDIIIPAICGSANGSISVVGVGGQSPYSYDWSNGDTGEEITNIPAGTYYVTLTDNNNCSNSAQFTLSNLGGPQIITDSILQVDCGISNGAIFITLVNGSSPFSYTWSNGSANQDITGLESGEYFLTVTDSSNCIYTSSHQVDHIQPNTDSLSFITVDTISNFNKLVWITDDPSILHFRVYRELDTVGNLTFIEIDALPINVFIDNSVDPDIQEWRYKITSIDSCGKESDFSPAHRTMHLDLNISNQYILLDWNPYEGFEYDLFYIYRRNGSNWDVIDSVSSITGIYADTSPPSGIIEYAIVVYDTIGEYLDLNKISGNCNHSRSNEPAILYNPVNNDLYCSENVMLNIVPNPNNGDFKLFVAASFKSDAIIKIHSIDGRVVFDQKYMLNKGDNILNLDLSFVDSGVYIIQIVHKNGINTEAIIIK